MQLLDPIDSAEIADNLCGSSRFERLATMALSALGVAAIFYLLHP